MTRWFLALSVAFACAAFAWRWLLSESDRRQREINRKWYEIERSSREWR